ncbi:MAG: methyltransferase domain-containing protein [Thermoplasmata archaeon]
MDASFALLLQVGLAALNFSFLAAGVAPALVGLLLLRGGTTRKSVDPDPASIRQARQNMEGRAVSEEIIFHEATLEDAALEGPYDLVPVYEVVHDLAYPVKALKKMRELTVRGGTVLIVDEAVGESLEQNRNFMGHLFYNFRLLHCLSQSMTVPNSAATGTVMAPSTLRRHAKNAGFDDVHVLPVEQPMFRLYRLTP